MKIVLTENNGKLQELIDEEIKPELEGCDFVFCRSEEEIRENLPDAEVLLTSSRGISREDLKIAGKLRLVQFVGVGYDSADLEACSEFDVKVANVPSWRSGNAESVAETAIMHMLILAKRTHLFEETFRARKIFAPFSTALWKKRVLVVGLGGVGHAIVERLTGLGMEVIGANRTIRPQFSQWGLKEIFPLSRLDEAVRGCRFVVLALPSKPETDGIIDKEILQAMDPDSWLINVARPNLVDREAFLKALNENQLAGAGLDVIWGEPADPNDPLFKDPRLSLSPHTGGVTDEFYKGAIAGIRENLSRQRDGREILNVVNETSKKRREKNDGNLSG